MLANYHPAIMGYSRKKQTGEVEDILFWIPRGIFGFLTLPLKILGKTRLYPRNSTKLCSEISKPLENPHDFFLITLGNSISFIINTWKIYLLFFQYPSKIDILNQHYGVECMVIWVYIFDSLICNFITIPHVPLKYITIAARNLW